MLFAVTLTLDALAVRYGYCRVKATFKRGVDVDRSRVVHRLLELVERSVFNQIKVGRGFDLVGKDNDNAHPRGTRLFCKSIYPHIIPSNRSSYPNHLSRVLVGMLVQLTKRCVNRQIACLGPTESAATQDENRNARTSQNQLHFGCSCCCCCWFGGCIAFCIAASRCCSTDTWVLSGP